MMDLGGIVLPAGGQMHQGYSLFRDKSSPAAPPVDLLLAMWTAVEKANQ